MASQLLSLFCGCVQKVLDQDNDGKLDFMESRKIGEQGDSLNDMLLNNLLSLRGRRNIKRDIPINIIPTVFEDEEDPPSEDEDGEEVSVLKGGVFAGQVRTMPKQCSY